VKTAAPPGLPVLMYHAVATVRGPLRELGVPADRFREHLDALRGAGYRLVGLTEALEGTDNATPSVALTFDDAYLDFGDAVPILTEYGASATLYVPVDAVGREATWLGDQAGAFAPISGWREVSEVADAGIEIGSHGLIHVPMDVMRPAVAARHLAASRDRIADVIGRPVRSFAYPHGYHTAKLRAAVQAAGYDNACTIGHRVARPSVDRFAISRLQPTPDIDGAHLLRMVHGERTLVPQLKRLAQPGWRWTRRIAGTAGVRLT
jgi:peptidoglycan/xylan/chitin deacetylase (PgdA/CDA1 family)